MPSKKISAILIVCISGIVSAWLISGVPSMREVALSNDDNAVVAGTLVEETTEEKEKNDDWKGLLTKVSEKIPVEKVSQATGENVDETSLTSQLSGDFFYKYLSLKSSDKPLTEAEKTAIVNAVISQKKYTATNGPVYLTSNLKRTTKTDPVTLKKYGSEISLIITSRKSEIKEDPTNIILAGIKDQNENTLKKLDPVILAGRGMIKDLLETEVPPGAVEFHLELLNASSAISNDLENIRSFLNDPVRGMLGLSEYADHIIKLEQSLQKMDLYIEKTKNL